MQYTKEKKDQSQKLKFLDFTILSNGAGKYKFKIHHKNAITSVQIKPNLFVNPALYGSMFKKDFYPEQKLQN